MGFQAILLDRSDGVATLTLNRPEVRNALDLATRDEIETALRELGGDESVRVLVVTGAGGHFCAGGDVKAMQARRFTAAEGRARVESMNRVILELVNFRAPTLAQVDGFAVGAGCNLALACDLIVASDRARFGEVFQKIGLAPDGGGSYLLPRLIGLAKAKELVFTGEIIDAAEALRIGLVSRVVQATELTRVVGELAGRIAAGPPIALALAKRLLNRAATLDLAGALDLEALSQAITIESEDHREGLRAFFEKRPPRFTGR